MQKWHSIAPQPPGQNPWAIDPVQPDWTTELISGSARLFRRDYVTWIYCGDSWPLTFSSICINEFRQQLEVGIISGDEIVTVRDAGRDQSLYGRSDSFKDVPPPAGNQPYKRLAFFTEGEVDREAVINNLLAGGALGLGLAAKVVNMATADL
jgi:hypothetical protein